MTQQTYRKMMGYFLQDKKKSAGSSGQTGFLQGSFFQLSALSAVFVF